MNAISNLTEPHLPGGLQSLAAKHPDGGKPSKKFWSGQLPPLPSPSEPNALYEGSYVCARARTSERNSSKGNERIGASAHFTGIQAEKHALIMRSLGVISRARAHSLALPHGASAVCAQPTGK